MAVPVRKGEDGVRVSFPEAEPRSSLRSRELKRWSTSTALIHVWPFRPGNAAPPASVSGPSNDGALPTEEKVSITRVPRGRYR